jgi:transcriptional regulator with XRE-family HTH domain
MKHKRFSDQIRAAVDASGLSRYAICKAIGFNQGAMSRFMAGKGGLSMEMLDRLADLLGLAVVARPETSERG